MEDNNFAMGYAMGKDANSNDGMFGGGNSWIWIIVVFALLFGWGDRGGNGANGNCNNGGGGFNMPTFIPYSLGGFNDSNALTRSELCQDMNFQSLENGVRGIQQGLCDGFYAQNTTMLQGFNGIQNSLCQGFNGVQGQISNLGYQLQDCCCQTQRAIDGVNYNMAKNTCDIQNTLCNNTRDIIENQNSNSRAILDFLTQDKIATLTAENQSLKFQASQTAQNAYIAANQEAQTAELIRRLGRDCPIPAYVVPNPNCCYGNQFGYYGYGQNNGGCGSNYNNGGGCC